MAGKCQNVKIFVKHFSEATANCMEDEMVFAKRPRSYNSSCRNKLPNS